VSSLPVPKGITYRDSEDKKRLEGRNGVIQTRYVFDCIDQWTTGSRLTSDTIKELQRLAVNQIYRCAGHFRDGPVLIQDVLHQPPDHTRVNALVEEMCDYVNSTWDSALAIDLASYVMWRINWIHPFFGGNGRTARSAAHLVLCAKLGFLPPGKETMPELIAANRDPLPRGAARPRRRLAARRAGLYGYARNAVGRPRRTTPQVLSASDWPDAVLALHLQKIKLPRLPIFIPACTTAAGGLYWFQPRLEGDPQIRNLG
jgi:hypothetical protein